MLHTALCTQISAEIPLAMRKRMLNCTEGGFTTYLVAPLDSDGSLTVAAAGHSRSERSLAPRPEMGISLRINLI